MPEQDGDDTTMWIPDFVDSLDPCMNRPDVATQRGSLEITALPGGLAWARRNSYRPTKSYTANNNFLSCTACRWSAFLRQNVESWRSADYYNPAA